MKVVAGLLAVVALGGCSVTEVPAPESTVAANACSDSSTCGGGQCKGGACIAGTGALDTVLIEVTPAASPATSGLADLAYYTRIGRLDKDILLPPVANLRGRVVLSPDDCTPEYSGPQDTRVGPVAGTIPVRATFTPNVLRAGWANAVQSVAGLPSRSYRSTAVDPDLVVGGLHEFDVWLPPGFYDVYIEPLPTLGDSEPGGCQIPPRLILGQEVKVSGTFELNFGTAQTLTFPVRWPMVSLANWAAQVIDERSGRVVSAPSKLIDRTVQGEQSALYEASLTYVPVQTSEGDPRKLLVRLVPPPESVAPTLIGDLSALSVGLPESGGFELVTPLPAPVTVEGQTAEGTTTRPVPATVTMTATRISGLEQCCFGSFVRTAVVNEKGVFSLTVPPGEYIVDAIPEADSMSCAGEECEKLASVRTTWQVGVTPSSQAGKLLSFPLAWSITGKVLATSGSAVSGAQVRANPSPFSIPMDYWNRADGRGSGVVPSTVGDLVDGDGNFALPADPGTFDLFVQPEPRTRFPWYVRPVLLVKNSISLGDLTLPLPVSNVGRVSIGVTGSSLPATTSLIRAYVFITREGEYTSAPTEGGAVIQVAETRTDDTGRYELLIPARLDSVPPGAL